MSAMRKKIMMAALVAVVAAVAAVQYARWEEDNKLDEQKKEIAAREAEIAADKKRNAAGRAEVVDLQTGSDAVEERARNDLGMIKEGETYYRVVTPEQ